MIIEKQIKKNKIQNEMTDCEKGGKKSNCIMLNENDPSVRDLVIFVELCLVRFLVLKL